MYASMSERSARVWFVTLVNTSHDLADRRLRRLPGLLFGTGRNGDLQAVQ